VELHAQASSHPEKSFVGRPVTVVVTDANPPFAITTAILRRLVAPGSRLFRADLVVPWHTAQRWTTGRAPGAGRWSHEFTTRVGRPLPRSAFSPPPGTESPSLSLREGQVGNSGGRCAYGDATLAKAGRTGGGNRSATETGRLAVRMPGQDCKENGLIALRSGSTLYAESGNCASGPWSGCTRNQPNEAP